MHTNTTRINKINYSNKIVPLWVDVFPLFTPRIIICINKSTTGITLKKSIEWLQHTYGFYIDEPIRTGVLFYKAVSTFKPNYYVDYLQDSPWIHMPYEKYEQLKVTDLK